MTYIEKIKVLQELFDEIIEKEQEKLKEIAPEDSNGFIKSSIFVKQIIINKELELAKAIKNELTEKQNETNI